MSFLKLLVAVMTNVSFVGCVLCVDRLQKCNR